MGMVSLKSMAHDDEALYDLCKGMPDDYEPPEYPSGLQFMLTRADLGKAGGGDGEPGDSMRFSAMGEVTSIVKRIDGCRIELSLTRLAGEDGKFFDLETPSCVCLCEDELEKLDLDADCERGDTLHLIGAARLEQTSSTEWGGDMATLQVTDLTYEDESEEAREG